MQKHLLHICLVFKKAGVQFFIHIVELMEISLLVLQGNYLDQYAYL